MNSTKFAQWFYWISIVALGVTALGVIWRFIIIPPDLKGLDVAGFAGSVLGVAATLLAILGAVAVAAWWANLDQRVTEQVGKRYDQQKAEIDRLLNTQQSNIETRIQSSQALLLPLEKSIKQSQAKIATIDKTFYDFEESITESFAALGPLQAEPIAQKAMAANKYPTFPFYMTVSYLNLFKQEDKLQHLEREITSYRDSIEHVQSYVNSNPDLTYSVPRSTMENHKNTLLSYLEAFNSPNLLIVSILVEWHRTVYWWEAAKANQPKTPSLKPEDFDEVQKEFDFYSDQIEKAEQDFDNLKSDTRSLLLRIEKLLQ